jgi:hypothetical protein
VNRTRWRIGRPHARRTVAGLLPTAAAVLALTAVATPSAAQAGGAPAGAPSPQIPTSYAITLVTSDTGSHLLAEVETGWRLRTVYPVELALDAGLRVVRVLVDGKPNTRLARTMYARQDSLIVVPHEKAPGDTLTTRVRYHGVPRGGAVVGLDGGARALVAQSAAGPAARWLPVPVSLPEGPSGVATEGMAAAGDSAGSAVDGATDPPRITVAWQVQASTGQRVIANGLLTGIDSLSYGHTTWHYRLDRPVPLDGLAAAAGRYTVTTLTRPACRAACPPVTLWTAPQDSAATLAGPLGRAGEILDWLSARLGPYPYPALAHVVTALAPGGAVAASVVLYDAAQLRAGAITDVDIARATATQWLGLATSDSGAAGARPSTATASYLAWLWTRERQPGPGGIRLTRQVDAIRSLHQTVGDSVFFRGLRRYLERNRDATAGPAAFDQAMTEAAGKRLDWSWRAAVGLR